MPYSLTLPNGFVVENIPDNIPRDQAMGMLEEKMPDAFPSIGEQLLRSPLEVGKGFIRSVTTDPTSGIASLAYTGARAAGADLVPFEKTQFGQTLGEAQSALAPGYGTVSQFMGGLGTLLGYIPGGLLKGGIGLATRLTQAGASGSEEARARAEEARVLGEADATAGQQFGSQLLGTGTGFSELLPIQNLIRPVQAVLRGVPASQADAIAPGLFNSAKRMLETGGLEGVQEGMANIAQDLIAKGIYNPDLEIGESALGDAAMGASIGAFAQGAIDLITRDKRRSIYEQLKQEERDAEDQSRREALAQQEAEKLARAQEGLGFTEALKQRQEVLRLPAPAVEVDDVPGPDPLRNPLGNFTEGDLTPEVTRELNRRRKEAGLPTLKNFSIEDLADLDAPQAQIDAFIANRLNQQGIDVGTELETQLAPRDVLGFAQSQGVDTSTIGFTDFLRRTTGADNINKMSPVQRLATISALRQVPEGTGILPQGTNATRFTDQQYNKAVDSVKKTFPDTDLLGQTSVIQEIKDFSGLTNDRDAESLLQTAIQRGDLTTVSKPIFEVTKDGAVVRKYNTRKSAEEAASKLGFGASVRERTLTEIGLPGDLKSLPGGPDIRKGTFQEGTEPVGYDVRSDTGVLSTSRTLDEANKKADSYTAIRQRKADELQEQITKSQAQIDRSQSKLEEMEATGQAGTTAYAKAAAGIANNNKNLAAKIERLNKERASLLNPLTVAARGQKPVTREGYTLFDGETPVGTFPNQQAAEQAAISRYDEDMLQRIADTGDRQRGLRPKRLAQLARDELARRRGEGPQGFGVEITGTPEEAAQRLEQAGVFTRQAQEQINELQKKLLPALKKLGLESVGLRIVRSIQEGGADGFYAQRLITIALDAKDHLGTLRHESIHALKELGAFKPNEWKVLERRAQEEWIDRFLKDRRMADGRTLFDAYKAIYQAENGNLNGFDAYITEEAIADAFKYFNQNKAPAGLIANLMQRLKKFFDALENAFKGLGFQTADDVFTRTEAGMLQPIRAGDGAVNIGATGFGAITPTEPVQDRTGAKLPTKPVSTRPVTESVPQLPPLPQAKPGEPSMPISRRSQSKGSVSAVPMSLLTTPEALQRVGGVLSVLDKSDPNESLRALNLAAERGGLAEWEARAIAFGRAEGAPGVGRAQLRVKPSEVVSGVIQDLGLSDSEAAATSLGLQTGRGGTNAFRQQDVGGIRDIVEFLEKRHTDSGMPQLDLANEADRDTLGRLLAAEVLSAIRAGGANIQWYDKVIDQMLGMASLKYPELRTDPNAQAAFRIAVAVSSQGMNVEDNLKFGERVYEQFSQNAQRGQPRFPEIGTGESKSQMQINFRIANKMIDRFGMDTFRRFLETPFTVGELNSAGLKITGELADEQVLGSSVFGPKIGFGFYSNLSGNFEPVTMDMWFMRTIGRLMGKLRSFDPAKYAQQVQRFRGSFGATGDNGIYANEFSPEEINAAIVDEQAMIDLARKVKSKHEKDFKKNRDLYDSDQRVKTDFVKASETIINSLDNPKDAPASGTERRLLRDVVRRMRDQIANATGQDIPPASLQAIAWYPEQELYKALGAKLRVTSQNYANAMRKLLEGEGFDGERISQSAKFRSRRPRRADAGQVGAGTKPTRRQPSRTLSPEERQSFLESGRQDVFFEREIESPKAKTIIFEVAPSPNDAKATSRWNQLSPDQKTRISKDVVDRILPQAMESLGIQGYVANQIGSYKDDTNPSFGLFIKKGNADQVLQLTKMIGYALSQKEMVLASPKETKGLFKNGAVRIPVGDINIQEVNSIYQRLRGIRVNGKPILDGQTTVHGNMVVMNFSGLPIEEFAQKIHEQLQGDYNVTIDDVYSNLIEEKEYNYGDPKSDPRGDRGVLRERSRTLRSEASKLLNQRIGQAERGRFSLRPTEPAGGPSTGGGLVLGKSKQPNAASYTGIHYGKERVNSLAGGFYGTGIKGSEAKRLRESQDPRIKRRVYFYIPDTDLGGRMPKPEGGLGQHVYRQSFDNILPPGEEMTRLYNEAGRDSNDFESAVIDAGYDGYAIPSMGMMVVMNHNVPVNYLGDRDDVKGTVSVDGQLFSLRATDTPEFKQWFGDSKITQDGEPRVMYHGLAKDTTDFTRKTERGSPIFLTDDPTFADRFAETSYESVARNPETYLTKEQIDGGVKIAIAAIKKDYSKSSLGKEMIESLQTGSLKDATPEAREYIQKEFINLLPTGPHIMPLYVRAERPFDYQNYRHVDRLKEEVELSPDLWRSVSEGSWEVIESQEVQEAIQNADFDSFYVKETGRKNLAVYEPNQVKSAIGNIGTFSQNSKDIRFSLALGALDPTTALIPDRGGNARGNLGMMPEQFDGKPIRLLIGEQDPYVLHKGYGANHILAVIMDNPRRAPAGSAELLDRVVSSVQDSSQKYTRIYETVTKTGALRQVLYDGKNVVFLSPERDHYSVITSYAMPNPDQQFGKPVWQGRAVSILPEEARGLQVESKLGRVAIKQAEVKTKKVYSPAEIARLAEEMPLAAFVEPVKKGTLSLKKKPEEKPQDQTEARPVRLSIREGIDPAIVGSIERTTTTRQEQGFGDRMAEAISPTAFEKFRIGFINRYESIERLTRAIGKQFGDKELLADTSAISAALMSDRASGVAAEAFKRGIPVYDKGYTFVDNKDGSVKGLMEILVPLAKTGDPFTYRAFQFYAAAKRGKRLDKEGREQVFTKKEQLEAEALKNHFMAMDIDFDSILNEYQKFNSGLVQYMVDTGVISKEMGAKWTENWDYIPFYRQLEGESTQGPNVFQSISGVAVPKKLKGGSAPLADFLETVVRNTRAAIEAGMKNVAAQRVARDVMRLNDPSGTAPMGRKLGPGERLGSDVITVRENGKDVHYQVADPLLIESLKGLNMPHFPFLEVLAKPAQVLRELVTKDPGFMNANLLRDSLQAWGTGQQITPLVDTYKQFAKVLANKSPEAQKLMRAGVGTGYEFKGDVEASTDQFAKQLRAMAGAKTTGEKLLSSTTLPWIWNKLDQASTASDLATRAEVFKRVFEDTGNEAEAVFQAIEVMNFSRKGSNPIMQIAAAAIPFLNARIQGLDLLYRAGFGKLADKNNAARQKAFWVRGATLIGISSLYWMLASETEEWKTAEPEARDNNWIIGSVRIPIPFELGVIFKVAPERTLEYFFGDDTSRDLKQSFVRNLTSTLGINPIPQAVLPIFENYVNYSFFTGQPIVGRGLEDVAKPFQVNTGTSMFAKGAGETLGMSPVQIDNLIRGYTGTIGGYAVMAMDAILRGEGDPTKATMKAEQLPVIKRFFATPQGTGTMTAYYELKKAVDESVRTVNFLERGGRVNEMAEYMQKHANLIGVTPYVRSLDKEVTMLRDMKRVVNNSQMDPDQKREALDAIRLAEVNMTRHIQQLKKLADR
jgi:hypothetical protein